MNADIAKKEWPEWICRFYVSPNVPESSVNELKSRDNVEVIVMNEDESWNGMFWRFYAASDTKVDVAIFRDADSRIGLREKAAVDEWLASDKKFHIMRDNCVHAWQIMGGMWGVRNWALSELEDLIENFKYKNKHNEFGIDQLYLSIDIYPQIWKQAHIHDDWFDGFEWEEKHPFPIPRIRCKVDEKYELQNHLMNSMSAEDRSRIWDGNITKFENEEGDDNCEFKKCDVCGIKHDDDYIGKIEGILPSDEKKYSYLIGDLI